MNRAVLRFRDSPSFRISDSLLAVALLCVTGEVLSTGLVLCVLVTPDSASVRLAILTECAWEVVVLAVRACLVADSDQVKFKERVDGSVPARAKTSYKEDLISQRY